MTCAMRELGVQFEKHEIFIPELLIAADALLAVMGVIEPRSVVFLVTLGMNVTVKTTPPMR